MFDLVLRGGRVIDPAQGIDAVLDVAFAGGKVAAIGDGLSGADTRDVGGKIVSPGLIDLLPREPFGLPLVAWAGSAVFAAVLLLMLLGMLK